MTFVTVFLISVFSISATTCCGQSVSKPRFLATNLKGFGIPFKINATDDSFIEVQLYVSYDRGKTWRFHDRQPTDRTEFPFRADADGEYWFALKTLNRNRQLIPEGNPSAELIIAVDTGLPELTFNIQTDPAGRIGCRWKATDKNLKADTLQILYQPIGASPDDWKQVPVNLNGTVRNGSYADQIHWWPDTTETSLNVRLSIADQAGNTVNQDRRINLPASPWRHRKEATARTGDANSNGQVLNQSTGQAPIRPNADENAPPEPIPFPLDNQTTRAEHSQLKPAAKSGSLAMNAEPEYICENGVCRLKSDLPKSDLLSSDFEKSKPITATPPTQLPRTAGSQPNGHAIPLVESKPAPTAPNRDLYAQLDEGSRNIGRNPAPTGNRQTPGSTWESEPERWTVRNQTRSSTTRSPEQTNVAPLQFPEPNPDNPDLPPSNPNIKKEIGDQVVGESSTTGPTSQYRLPEQIQPVAPPQFQTGNVMAKGLVQPGGSSLAAEHENWPSDDRAADGGSIVDGASGTSFTGRTKQLINNPVEGQGVEEQGTGPQPVSSSQPNHPAMSAAYPRDGLNGSSVIDESPDAEDSSIQMISAKRFRLNYGIDAIDSSGVARVDLWMTRDNGSTWKSWGTDPENTSPFPVEVEEEGRYGFRIVIHSKDGLTGRGPSRGDKPDLFVHVDSQAPLVQIMSVPYGRGDDVGRLVINYRVTDPWLTLRPVSLYYSTTPEGPWTPIAEGLRNESRYIWKPATNVPDRIFLRLDAIDRATNKGTHTLSQAIDVSGLVPRGTIHGVVPVGR